MKRISAFLLICFLSYTIPCIAATKEYIAPETTITWTDSGGDELLDLGGASAGTSTMGSFLDLGAGSRALDYEYEMTIDGFDSAPVVGETVVLYFSQSNATTNFDGNPTSDPTTSAEGTIIENALKNLILADAASVYTTAVGDELKISGIVRLPLRYVSPVVHNNTADALESSGDSHTVTLTPIPNESQTIGGQRWR